MSPRFVHAAALAVAAALACPLPAAASGPVPQAWEHAQDLTVPAPGLIEVSVPAATLDKAQPGLGDLRIFDSRGDEVSFAFVARPAPPPRGPVTASEISQTSTEEATVGVYRTGAAGAVDTVTVRTPARDFIKPVTVEASEDLAGWRALAVRYPIYRQHDGAERLDIAVAPGVYRYLRITVGDARDRPIPLAGVTTTTARIESRDVVALSLVPVSVSSGAGVTRVLLTLPARHLRLRRIALDPEDAVFSREVAVAERTEVDGEIRETPLARGRIHRVALAGAERTEVLGLAVPGGPRSGRSLVVTIEDGDSPPLTLRRQAAVTVEPVRLRFLARAGERYALSAGNPTAKPPRYDLAAIPAVSSVSPAGNAVPGRLEKNPAFVPPEPAKGAPAEGAVIDTAQWRGSRRVLFAGGSVLALEVPPEVLSASPGLADLRLASEGRQLPYIMERGTVARRLVLPVAALAAERDRGISRWRVALPQRALPLDSIACEAPETVFRRRVTVLDDVPPELGGRVTLADAVWERRGQGAGAPLQLALRRAPAGESLLIEVDDGDNPPLTLKECAVGWRTSRLLFKQPGARAVTLLYGNPGVGPPRYDLTLLADELLAADAAAATLAPDEGRGRGAGIALPGGWRRAAFWGALALVVAVLIAVIARLLPAPKQE